MSENTSRPGLAELAAFEAAAFRIGQLARRLRADHPDLPIASMEPTAWVLTHHDGHNVHADLDIRPGSVDDVRAWATALGVEATVTTSTKTPYERATAEAVLDSVMVKVTGGRPLTGDEYAAWQAEHAPQPAEGGEDR